MVKDRKFVSNSSNSTQSGQNRGASVSSFSFYALKVQKSAEHYTEAAMDEVELLDCIAAERKKSEALLETQGPHFKDSQHTSALDVVNHAHHVATLHDSFFHTGPNGRHMCMVFSMLGCNLLSVIKAYNYRGIPIPAVKIMIKGIAKGLDFLHRKCEIIHTDLKPENVLLQFPSQISERHSMTSNTDAQESNHDNDDDHPDSMTIEELEMALRNPKTPTEERKKIRKRLKKRRQRDRRKLFYKDEEDCDDPIDSQNTSTGLQLKTTLSDVQLECIINETVSPLSNNKYSSVGSSHDRVLSRISHNPFIMRNFSTQLVSSPEQSETMTGVMDDMVKVLRPNKSEINAHFRLCSAQINTNSRNRPSLGAGGGGVAEVSFLLRAFVPEGEIADNISALLGIPWERSEATRNSREWRCGLSVQRTGQQSIATMFKLIQHGRKDIDDGPKKVWTDMANIIGANLSGRSINDSSLRSKTSDGSLSNRSLPFSVFTVKFSVLSSMVVLGFLEQRLPGLMFFAYKRDEGSPSLDSVVFGSHSRTICNHPLAMKVKDIGNEDNSHHNSVATSLFGFDLRLVKEFAARPTIDEDGAASFQMRGPTMEKVSNWWHARHPIHVRVKIFMGVDPKSDVFDMPVFSSTPTAGTLGTRSVLPNSAFIEGGKKSIDTDSPISSNKNSKGNHNMATSAEDAMSRASQQPDLKDMNVLMKSRAVVVDLGNACWTHRHFSEDIQTRQYRAPEVLVGSSYDTAADMWSLGCITFELLTGDLLFDPRAGDDYDRDEDHLAMFQELLGKMPKTMALSGDYSRKFFDRNGNLRHIKQLKFWPVEEVLHEKYHFSMKDAEEISNFMLPLLDFDPSERATALECLKHEWLQEA